MTATRHDVATMALKVATRRLIEACGGTDGAGTTCGVRQQRMSDCQNPNSADFLRISEVAALEDVSVHQPGYPHVTRALAWRQGFALVQLPDPGAAETIWSGLLARLAKEGGDVMSRVCAALADDNDVSPREAADVLTDADELVNIAVQLQCALRRRAEEKQGG